MQLFLYLLFIKWKRVNDKKNTDCIMTMNIGRFNVDIMAIILQYSQDIIRCNYYIWFSLDRVVEEKNKVRISEQKKKRENKEMKI